MNSPLGLFPKIKDLPVSYPAATKFECEDMVEKQPYANATNVKMLSLVR